MADAIGWAKCRYCGAEYKLFTIFNRSMQGLCNAWRIRHERTCRTRTPEQRRKWAKKYVGNDSAEHSLLVDMSHEGFKDGEQDNG